MKKISLGILLAALFILCSSCSTAAADGAEEAGAQQGTQVQFDHFRVTIPERIHAVQEADGSVDFRLSAIDTRIGGITTIPYENADKFNLELEERRGSEDTMLEDFVKLIASDKKIENYFYSSEEGQENFSLSIGYEDGSDSEIHYFYPQGNQFYDVFFFEKPAATPEEQEIIGNSFAAG